MALGFCNYLTKNQKVARSSRAGCINQFKKKTGASEAPVFFLTDIHGQTCSAHIYLGDKPESTEFSTKGAARPCGNGWCWWRRGWCLCGDGPPANPVGACVRLKDDVASGAGGRYSGRSDETGGFFRGGRLGLSGLVKGSGGDELEPTVFLQRHVRVALRALPAVSEADLDGLLAVVHFGHQERRFGDERRHVTESRGGVRGV